MKKFVFEYYGGLNPHDMAEEKMKEVMGKWRAWFGAYKDNFVDSGNPYESNGMSVTPEGAKPIASDMWPSMGYSIINASSMDAAVKIAQQCPKMEEGNGATIRVYEAIPM